MKKNFLLAVSVVVFSGISTIQATTLNNSNGLIGVGITPAYTLTFDNAPGLSANSLVTNQFAFAGVTFSAPAYYDGNTAGGNCGFFNQGTDCITNYSSNPRDGVTSLGTHPFSILFATPQVYAAFSLVTDNNGTGNTIIGAYRNGVLIAEASPSGPYTTASSGVNYTPNNYFGFYNESTPFNEIRITTSGANLLILDNLQVQSTPEPATIGLFSAGLIGVVVAARRRRRSA